MRELTRNMVRVAEELFEESGDRDRFLDAIGAGDGGAQAVVWVRRTRGEKQHSFDGGRAPAWLPSTVTVPAAAERPGKSDVHENGDIYCLDLSSVFACVPFAQIPEGGTIVDVCASPGGKGIVAWSTLTPTFILANEVIRKRTAALISNYKRCRIAPSAITSLDPERLAASAAGRGDLVIVDAPCSGQSLMLKGLAAPGAFHPATISMNARRQRRIIASSAALVSPGGHLVYSTCTFSPEENERVVTWFLSQFEEFESVPVPALSAHQSSVGESPCYRLWPYEGFGAGAFCALFRRRGDGGDATAGASLAALEDGVVWSSERAKPASGKTRKIYKPKGKVRDRKKLRPWDYE